MTRRRPKGHGSVQVVGGSIYARWTEGGRDHRRPATDEREAEGLLAYVAAMRKRHGITLLAALARVDAESQPEGPITTNGPTFAKLLDLFLAWCDRTGHLRESTLHRYRQRAGLLRKAPWADRAPGEFTRRDVRAWVAERTAGGAGGKTLLNDCTLASTAWRWADDEELLDPDLENPFLRARPRRFKRKERRVIDEAGLCAIGDAMREHAPACYPFYLASVFTGWRAGEVAGLRESDLSLDDPDGPCLHIDGSREKTGKSKTAFLGEPLVSILRAEREAVSRLPSACIFTNEDGRPWTRKTWINRLRRALAAVPESIIPAADRVADETHLGIDWHTLRHSVRSVLSARGHRPAVLGELLGQANIATARRYDHGYRREAVSLAVDLASVLEGTQTAASKAQA